MRPIPFVDVRDGGPVAHAHASRGGGGSAARRLSWRGPADWTHGCLRADRPYRRELAAAAPAPPTAQNSSNRRHSRLSRRDDAQHVLSLRLHHQAYEADAAGAPVLRRTLDWPFRGLGKCVEIAWQSGPAGEFYNVTWPGPVGVLSAMAPGRFCAVINQAPMQRRTRGSPRLSL